MIKIITSRSYQHLIDMYDSAVSTNVELYQKADEQTVRYKQLSEENENLKKERDSLKEQVEQLQKTFASSNENSVTLQISDDLTKVSPIVRFKPSTFDKFAELGYLKDEQEGNTFAAQLALLTVVQEALTQILDSFTDEVA